MITDTVFRSGDKEDRKFSSLWNLVGNTPMVEIVYSWRGTVRSVFAKCEYYNLTGSIKDRVALHLLESQPIHVAVLDQHMPQLSGLQVIKLMRDMKDAPPAILLAEHLTNHLLHDALAMHVFSVLSKPVDLNLLLDALARVMRRYYESRWPTESS